MYHHHRYIFDPNAPSKVRWDLWIGALIVYSVISIPYRLCFDVEPDCVDLFGDCEDFLEKASGILVDVFFGIDIVFAFRTGFHDIHEDALITTPHEIASNYLRTWFCIGACISLRFASRRAVHSFSYWTITRSMELLASL